MDNKGKVGPFFYIHDRVYCDAVNTMDAEPYGDFKTWGSHYKYWDVLVSENREFRYLEYNHFPRGRVTYNFSKNIFYVYLNPKLNKVDVIDKIIEAYELSGLNYIIDDKDEHYHS